MPKATPPARRERGEKCIGAETAANAATPNCVLGALPSPFGSAFSASETTPGSSSSYAACRVTTRRQSRLSAANADAASLATANAAASLKQYQQAATTAPPPLLTDALFAPLATGLELRTRSSLSFEDKVTASSATLLDPSPSLLEPLTFAFSRAFDFERVIGRSELSEVWLARHRGSGKRFAVKRSAAAAAALSSQPALASSAASAAAAASGSLSSSLNSRKTAREVSVVARVPPHQNLVAVLRSWREKETGNSFIQMDYCCGGSLAEAVHRAARRSRREQRKWRRSSGSAGGGEGEGERASSAAAAAAPSVAVPTAKDPNNKTTKRRPRALPLAAVWRVAAHASAALEALHSARVVHMDVKPENIYLDWKVEEEKEEGKEEGERDGGEGGGFLPAVVLRLGDFGLSIQAPGGEDQMGGEEAAEELPWEEGDGRYVAPELLSSSSFSFPSSSSSSPRPTPAADVFSLGATLFECATGIPPPRGGGALPRAEAAAAVVAALAAADASSSSPSSSSASASTSSSDSAALLADLIASSMIPDPRERPSAALLSKVAAEGDAGCRRGEADAALVAGLLAVPRRELLPAAAAANAPPLLLPGGGPSSTAAAPTSFSLLRRSDARRRGYTLDGSASVNLSSLSGEEQGAAGNAAVDGEGDSYDDEDEDSDALLFSKRPPSAPRAGHSRRRTPRSVPSSPAREGKKKPPSSSLVPFPPTTATTAAARPALSPLSLEPLAQEMSIGGGGGEEAGEEDNGKPFHSSHLDPDLERALSSMSIDGLGAENASSPGSPARSRSPWPPPPPAAGTARVPAPPQPQPRAQPRREASSFFAPLNGTATAAAAAAAARFGFGLIPAAAPAPAPAPLGSPFDDEQQRQQSVEGLGETVRQLSMSLSLSGR